jgi:hypothetical protein
MSYKIGFIGLGALGTPIAINLASYAKENNFTFAVWNRSPDKYSALKEAGHDEGVFFASRPEELVERCNLIFTVLVNDQAAEAVYGKLIGAVKGKVVFADVSTLLPKTSSELKRAESGSYARRAGTERTRTLIVVPKRSSRPRQKRRERSTSQRPCSVSLSQRKRNSSSTSSPAQRKEGSLCRPFSLRSGRR